jgi:hypothetical protein
VNGQIPRSAAAHIRPPLIQVRQDPSLAIGGLQLLVEDPHHTRRSLARIKDKHLLKRDSPWDCPSNGVFRPDHAEPAGLAGEVP